MRPLLALLTALAVLAPGLAAAQTSPPGFCDRNPDHWKCQATPTPTPTPTPGTGERPLKSARDLTSAVCVNVHWTWTGTVYGNWSAAKQAVLDLGAKCLRDQVDTASSTQRSRVQELAAAGVKHDMIVDGRYHHALSATAAVDYMLTTYPGGLLSVEGENEPDVSGRCSQARAGLAELSAERFDPRMTGIRVLGAAMANPSNYSSCLGNQSGSVDVGNMHSFPGGENPEAQVKGSTWSLAGFKTNALLSYPGKPLWSTETGYHNATWSSAGHRPASEQVAAIYGVQLPIHYALRGIDRAFFYELLDDGNTSDIEDHFGLVRNDWSRKPLFTGLRNLLAILADSGPAPMTSLAYTATGPPGLRRVLAQKSDGSWWLALYNDVRIWDSASASPISQPTTTATVAFTAPRNVAVYDPARGTGAIANATGVTRTNVTLPPAQLVLVRIL